MGGGHLQAACHRVDGKHFASPRADQTRDGLYHDLAGAGIGDFLFAQFHFPWSRECYR